MAVQENCATTLSPTITPQTQDNITDTTHVDENFKEGDDELTADDDDATAVQHTSFLSKVACKLDAKLLKNFSPAWYASVMATGISSAILHNFPFPSHWLMICSYIIWSVGIFFFITITSSMIILCYRYPTKIRDLHMNPTVAPFMGCLSMGYNSLVNELYFITGTDFIIGIFVLWWILVFFCLYTSFIVFYFTFMVRSNYSKKREYRVENTFTPVMLLPIVALTVTSLSGQLFATELPGANLQVLTVIISYVLWAVAMAMSFISLTLIFHKYLIHKAPLTPAVFTSFIPIGFLGQGAFSILLCGENLHKIVLAYAEAVDNYAISGATTNSSILASCLLIGCAFAGLFLISFGYFNTLIAVTSVLLKVFTKNPNVAHTKPVASGFSLIKYHPGFWAMTFPLGTMALGNSLFGELFGLLTFKVIGAIYGVVTVVVTTGCCFGCLIHVYRDLLECL